MDRMPITPTWRRLLATCVTALVVSVGLAVPASASALVPRIGYAYAFSPTAASYTVPEGFYAHNGALDPITIHRTGTGRYDVRFAGLGSDRGVAHVVPYGSSTRFCTVGVWYRSGRDQVVPVRCFTAAGVPVDTTYLVNFSAEVERDIAAVTFLTADRPTAATYSPSRFHDSSGGTPTIRRVAKGSYGIRLPAVDAAGTGAPVVHQVTAIGDTAVHCHLYLPTLSGEHNVWCQDPRGVRIDHPFALTMTHRGDPLGVSIGRFGYAHVDPRPDAGTAIVRSSYTRGGGAITATSDGPGRATVVFAGLAGARGHAVAHIFHSGHATCAVLNWFDRGADKVVNVHCFEVTTGAPRSADVVVGFR